MGWTRRPWSGTSGGGGGGTDPVEVISGDLGVEAGLVPHLVSGGKGNFSPK